MQDFSKNVFPLGWLKMIIVDTIMNSYSGKTGAGHHLWNNNLTEKDQNTVYA